MKEVMTDLSAANFDPEFFKQYEGSIINEWNKQYPDHSVSTERQTKKGLFSKLLKSIQPS